MKVTKLPDGTTQIEGTPEEIREMLAPPKDAIGRMVPQAGWIPTPLVYTNNAWPTNAAANPLPTWWGTWRA